MSDHDTNSSEESSVRNPRLMAEELLEVEEGDEIRVSFLVDGDEVTTRQTVVSIGEYNNKTEIICEEQVFADCPSVGLIVETYSTPTLQPKLKHPMDDPTNVEQFTELEITKEVDA